jgi:hypothetical protein
MDPKMASKQVPELFQKMDQKATKKLTRKFPKVVQLWPKFVLKFQLANFPVGSWWPKKAPKLTEMVQDGAQEVQHNEKCTFRKALKIH